MIHNPCCSSEPNDNALLTDPRIIESYPDLYNPLSVNTSVTETRKKRRCKKRRTKHLIIKRCCFLLFAILIIAFLCKC